MPGWTLRRSNQSPNPVIRYGSSVPDVSSVAIDHDNVLPSPPPGSKPRPPTHSAPQSSSFPDSLRSQPPSNRASTMESTANSLSASRSRRYSEAELGESVVDSTQLVLARVMVSALAVLLLWLSSAAAVRIMLRSSGALPYTSSTRVVDSIALLLNETARMRREYVECVVEQLEICNATLVYRANTEVMRSEEAQRHNQQERDEGQQMSSACVSARANAHASVSTWLRTAGTMSTPSAQYVANASCTSNDRARLEALTGDTSAQRSASMQLVVGYSHESQSTVGLLGEQLVARGAYDVEYLRNRTLGDAELDVSLNITLAEWRRRYGLTLDGVSLNMSEFLACATFGMGPCPTGIGAADLVNQAQARLTQQFNHAAGRVESARQEAHRYINASQAKFLEATAAFTYLYYTIHNFPQVGGGNLWNDLFPGGYSFPLISIPIGSAAYPNLPSTPTLDLRNVPTPVEMAALAQPHLEAYQNSLNAAHERAADELDKLVPSIRANISIPLGACSGVPCDYQPPEVDAIAVVGQHEQDSDEFEQDMMVVLDTPNAIHNHSSESASSYTLLFARNLSASELARAALNTDWFRPKNYYDPGIQIDEMLAWFFRGWSLFELVDTIWRILETVRILRSFWGRSALNVAPIDIASDADSKARATSSFKVTNPIVQAAAIATHPLVVASLLIFFASLIGYVAFSFYMIPFTLYRAHCTSLCHEPGGVCDGTFLTGNAFSLAFNSATSEGTSKRLKGIDEYERRRVELCAAYGVRSAQDERQVRSEYDIILSSHVRAQGDVHLMRRCYDTGYLDLQWAQYSTALAPYELVSAALASSACDAHLTNATLEDGAFDCTELPECNLGCDDLIDNEGVDGPAAEELFALSRLAMCTFQHWAHSIVVRNVFVVIIWIFINLGRIILLMGISRLAWEHLNTGHFAFLGTARHDGTSTHDPEELADKIHSTLRHMRLIGLGMLLIALALQVIWLIPLLHFSDGLKASMA